jgi:hypothetical protein
MQKDEKKYYYVGKIPSSQQETEQNAK